MPSPFHLTERSLEQDSGGVARGVALTTALLLLGWVTWFVAAQVDVWVLSDDARLEGRHVAARIEAPDTPARIASLPIRPGMEIAPGDVIVTFDDRELVAELQAAEVEEQTAAQRLAGYKDRLQEHDLAVEAETNALRADRQRAEAAVREVEALLTETERELARVRSLRDSGLSSVAVQEQAVSQRDAASGRLEARRAEVRFLEQETTRVLAVRRSERLALADEIADLEAQSAVVRERIETLRTRLERYRIVSPFRGHVGSMVSLPIDRVEAGQWLATLIPEGEVDVVAAFPPAEAAGVVRRGMGARFRVRAYDHLFAGTLPAVVQDVSTEPRDGVLDVRLTLASQDSRVELAPGLPGRVEIRVGKRTPASLALQAVGRLMNR
ncbi:MAG: HlyD family efflux transporter periplasmic adaptor subunit [bacterium]